MLPVILPLLASMAALPAAAEAPRQDPGIRVWLNKSGYVEPMEKVRAYLRTGVDGFVIVLHAEPSGRVRVLFPLDPEDDAWVRAGQDFEIRSRSDREAFVVYDGSGAGVILAAVSRDPFRFDGMVLNRHWDYRAAEFGVGNDAESDLLALVQRMTGGGWFDYDVVRYDVATYFVADGGGTTYHLSLYGPAYAGHYWAGGVGFTIGFGTGWYDPWYYPPHYWSSWYWPTYWYPCCYYGWYRPYPVPYAYYPYYGYPYGGHYGYPPGYYAQSRPTYARHFYAAGSYGTGYYYSRSGAWGTYAFKSAEDRYGLQPQSVTARRRTAGTGAAFATGSVPTATTGRRGVTSTPSSTAGVSAGTLEARRRTPTGASSAPTVLPTINGRRRAAEAQAAGTASPTATNADGRRIAGEARSPMTTGDAVRRGLEIVPPGRSDQGQSGVGERRVNPTTANPTGVRQVDPRRVTDTPSRSAQGTVGSGRTTKPSSGSLERRTPTRSVTPPRSTTPSRTVSPPRSAPSTTRSAPSTTRSAPRAAPSRPPTRSAPPQRSSPPPSGGRRRN